MSLASKKKRRHARRWHPRRTEHPEAFEVVQSMCPPRSPWKNVMQLYGGMPRQVLMGVDFAAQKKRLAAAFLGSRSR